MNNSPDTNNASSDTGWQLALEGGYFERDIRNHGFRLRLEAVPLRKGLKSGPTATIDFAKALNPRVGLGLNSSPERLAAILDEVATVFPEIATLVAHNTVRPVLARTPLVQFHLTHDSVRLAEPLKFQHQTTVPSGEPLVVTLVVTSIHIDEQGASDDCSQEGREFVGSDDITPFAPDTIRAGWGSGRPWTVETINGTRGFFTASTVVSTNDFDVVFHARSVDGEFYAKNSSTYMTFPEALTHPAMSEAVTLMNGLQWPSRAKDPLHFRQYSTALTEQGRAFKKILAETIEESREADALLDSWGGTTLVQKTGEPMLKSYATLVQVDLGAAGTYDHEHDTDEGRFRVMHDSLRVGWLTLIEFLPAGTASLSANADADAQPAVAAPLTAPTRSTPTNAMDIWEDWEDIAVVCECSWRGTLGQCQMDSESEAVAKMECPSCGATHAVLNTSGFLETIKKIAEAGGVKAQKHLAGRVEPIVLPVPNISDAELQALAVADTAEWMFLPREKWAAHPLLAHVESWVEDWSMFDNIFEGFELVLDVPGVEGFRDFAGSIGFAYFDNARHCWAMKSGNITQRTTNHRAIWYSEDPTRSGNFSGHSVAVAFLIPAHGATTS